jgi:hypothetical protein
MTDQYKNYSWIDDPTPPKSVVCPVCDSAEFYIEGEYVDIGVGYQKCSPDMCDQCGYIESNGKKNQLPFEYYKERWDTKIDPIAEYPKLRTGPLPEKYRTWMDQHVEKPYGNCQEYTRQMKQVFPGLQTVYGTYLDLVWGQRHHFFLYDPELDNLVVDPTESQFPGRTGIYRITYPVDIFTLERTDYKCWGWDFKEQIKNIDNLTL